MHTISRRTALKGIGAAAMAGALPKIGWAAETNKKAAGAPSWLRGYEGQYAADPRKAAQAWFADARFGLFMHYGLYSILGRHEWVMFREKIPVAQYEKLRGTFHPGKFDADFITDMAADAGMKYVNLTSKHHDGFCLFDTRQTDYNSVKVVGRDLVAELAEQARKKGLGVFYYYSLAADWHHPYYLSRDYCRIARPAYEQPQPEYKLKRIEDFDRYVAYATEQVRELVTNYGPIAGIWFDPYMGYFAAPERFRIDEIYAMIRKAQPHCLVSFKQGVTGDEDFAAPERSGHSLAQRVEQWYGKELAVRAQKAWEKNATKHNEICDTMQPHGWGYIKKDEGKHKSADQVMQMLGRAFGQDCNLLLNTGPLPDGSIHPADVSALKEVGRRIRAEGYPKSEKGNKE